jgi:hypothetical protein
MPVGVLGSSYFALDARAQRCAVANRNGASERPRAGSQT